MADLSFIQNELRVLQIKAGFEHKKPDEFIIQLNNLFKSSTNEVVSIVFEKVSHESIKYGFEYSDFKAHLDPIVRSSIERKKTHDLTNYEVPEEEKPTEDQFRRIQHYIQKLSKGKTEDSNIYSNVSENMRQALLDGDKARLEKKAIREKIRLRKNSGFQYKCPCGSDVWRNICGCKEFEFMRSSEWN